MLPLPQLVSDALRLHADHPARGAAHLTEAFGLKPQTSLTLALELLIEERRDIDLLTKAEHARHANERLVDKVECWGRSNSEADAKGQFQGILDGNVAHAC
jgi:hypothetical protein